MHNIASIPVSTMSFCTLIICVIFGLEPILVTSSHLFTSLYNEVLISGSGSERREAQALRPTRRTQPD